MNSHLKRIFIGFIGGIVLFIASMVDGRMIYNPNPLVDCRVGQALFTLKKSDCKTQIVKIYSSDEADDIY